MKILYGVQGTGNGHIARARVMAKAFVKRDDVQVDFIFSGREPEKYFDMQIFGDYRCFSGLTFITQRGAVKKWQTVKRAKIKQLTHDVRSLDLSGYDLVLNDFEPVTAWAAKLQGKTSISVSHQAAFKHNVPKQGETLGDRILMRFFAPCEINLGVHWYHFGFPIMPPFIEEKVDLSVISDQILVYLPFECTSAISQMLAAMPDQRFICYHPDVEHTFEHGNAVWHPPAKIAFQQALIGSKGVIANGGFELASECLQLGKKLLIKPLKGQYEQSSNRITLENMGLAHSMDNLDVNTVKQWLSKPEPEAVSFPDSPDMLIDWLMKRQWHDTQAICDQLWRCVSFPNQVQRKLATF